MVGGSLSMSLLQDVVVVGPFVDGCLSTRLAPVLAVSPLAPLLGYLASHFLWLGKLDAGFGAPWPTQLPFLKAPSFLVAFSACEI